ncbi:MAG: GTPase Era [Pseudohongiellaceae bacterium]
MKKDADSVKTFCGYIAIVGRPNVGKSTLLNHLLRQKISITSRKPQTTRHRILGITSENQYQCVFVDTPGLNTAQKKILNRIMNETVLNVVADVDVVVFVIETLKFNEGDLQVLALLERIDVPVILAINKIDLIKAKDSFLPHIDKLSKLFEFREVVPISAATGYNVEKIAELTKNLLPEGQFLFPRDQITNRSSRFLAAELIREKITRQLGEEVPYEATVEVENFVEDGKILKIDGLILVDKPGQKKIIIGKGGSRLKRIGSNAREDMEKIFEKKVMLNLWVKVKSGWADDQRALQSLGYFE